MEEYKEALEYMVNLLLKGEWSVAKFKKEFCRFYLEEVPEEVLSDNEWLFYSTIHQSLDSLINCQDHGKYIDWVQQQQIYH